MNIMFFSNEVQPLMLDSGDRRYLVLWTPPKLPPDTYTACMAEIEAGGAEAFYDYLMKVPLGDQRPSTWPPMTKAKRDLITLGKPSSALFADDWRAGLTPFPYCTASSMDVYEAYKLYCLRVGERMAWSSKKFLRELERHIVKKPDVRFMVPGSAKVEIATMLIVADNTPAPPGEAQRYVYGRSVGRFREALEAARGGAWTVLAPPEGAGAVTEDPIL